MGKIPILVVALLLLGVFRLNSVDFEGLADALPIGGAPGAAAATNANVGDETAPAEEAAPPDVGLWFAEDAEADPYAEPLWAVVEELLTDAESTAGWTALCALATTATGADRTASPLPGALACSEDASVTELQQLAVAILRTQASTALWLRGAPGYSAATISARQGEVRLRCATGSPNRGDESATVTFAAICSQALDSSWKSGDGPATFTAVKAAYAGLATVIAERDATADAVPTFFKPPEAEATDPAAEAP
jgi:hypothetical protein